MTRKSPWHQWVASPATLTGRGVVPSGQPLVLWVKLVLYLIHQFFFARYLRLAMTVPKESRHSPVETGNLTVDSIQLCCYSVSLMEYYM